MVLTRKRVGGWEFLARFSALVFSCLGRLGEKIPRFGTSCCGFSHNLLGLFGDLSNCRIFAALLPHPTVGSWSADLSGEFPFLLSPMGFCPPPPCAHNPEVVGSSPASATRKTPDFERNQVFL